MSEETLQNKTPARPYHHGDLRNALIKTGLEILSQEGANALSLRKVAKKAGVSHAAPYRHFADKEALIIAIAEDGFEKLATKIEQAIAAVPDDFRAQLQETGWAYVSFALENPDHLRVMFTNLSKRQDLNDSGSFELLVDTIRRCQEAGIVARGDPLQLAVAAWSMAHGIAILLIEDKIPPVVNGEITAEQVAQACIKTLYNGLAAR